ncbi:unannotated protein [freshwater metagenome]|uniref:Unannotated protein n=1 Tax=freshwater metagenome TaxID=449393 RepID=A0A6J6WRI8_9ZZZZ
MTLFAAARAAMPALEPAADPLTPGFFLMAAITSLAAAWPPTAAAAATAAATALVSPRLEAALATTI